MEKKPIKIEVPEKNHPIYDEFNKIWNDHLDKNPNVVRNVALSLIKKHKKK